MKKYSMLLAALLLASGAAQAVGTITGLSASPAQAIAGESVAYKIATSGSGACGVRLVYSGPNYEPSDNMLINNAPGAGGVIHKTIAKAGTYQLKAIGSPSLNPKCNGEANLTVVVVDKPAAKPGLQIGATGPVVAANPGIFMMEMNCPNPYHKYTQGVNQSKGEYYCVKQNVSCPAGFTGSMDSQTGKLVCTPQITATCPEGWTGGVVDGKLVCNSIPQPNIPCPKATPDWKWGTAYYKESWNKMGCNANLEPPK